MFYWTCYHAFFAALGDVEHRGSQLGARQALSALAGILGPAAGGAMLAAFGAWTAFGAAAIVTIAAAIPLRAVAEPRILRVAPPQGLSRGTHRRASVRQRRLDRYLLGCRLGYERFPRACIALRVLWRDACSRGACRSDRRIDTRAFHRCRPHSASCLGKCRLPCGDRHSQGGLRR